ncbi:flagellar biosynthetic protein FliQ [Roseateles sp. SL47]|uniref:EscS/YscS/HrcS family type III secretion system export apparatus protein n=1 Tax=Roseateles sp. SL47 TaxID=2995138 RepID=UPI002270E260|nr:flagellar biosynthetic protein FliQ [Roseateles sp. SL47]WAC74571.1 flagellar biosynthetic protein FliQ [Roseateles sp. SL47]
METITLFREALVMVVMLSAPALVVTTVLGVLVSLVQGLFQVQDQALSFTIKVVALVVVLLLTGQWMLTELFSLTNHMFVLLGQRR